MWVYWYKCSLNLSGFFNLMFGQNQNNPSKSALYAKLQLNSVRILVIQSCKKIYHWWHGQGFFDFMVEQLQFDGIERCGQSFVDFFLACGAVAALYYTHWIDFIDSDSLWLSFFAQHNTSFPEFWQRSSILFSHINTKINYCS